ncbi:metal-sensitive transcriptional regulator [Falsarthrobacter nasiphocae]|uniref:DNA-binding FrmR family transcriptional regulator n=1 Tax=Falsarthrobacter nasiphocae TaxID=189863 RepID=A0AAE4C6H6_9MICC|nr:metal-sensitive transcriptional regulator [Falsarthrobacter nasiphocae]MDR6892177.1 DNA-binding FrmR family transcriptional regulator [Falsarthrobacter nasiphocae]
MKLDPQEMKSAVNRLKRAQGQLGAVIRMIEDGQECQEVVTQLAAVSKAVDRAGFVIISTGLQQCISEGNSEIDAKQLEKMFLSLA